MDDIKLFAKSEKALETGNEDIQWIYRDGIWHRKMFRDNNEKLKTIKWRNE